MLLLATVLVWIALVGSTASVGLGVASFVKRRTLASAFLLDGSLLVWTPLICQKLVGFESGAARWLTLVGIAFIVAYVFLQPWRKVPAEHRRIFIISLAGFVVIFSALFILRVVLFSTITPDRNISRTVSVTLDMAQTFFTVSMVLLAAVAFIWLCSETGNSPEGEPD